jgi:hypothetical protein
MQDEEKDLFYELQEEEEGDQVLQYGWIVMCWNLVVGLGFRQLLVVHWCREWRWEDNDVVWFFQRNVQWHRYRQHMVMKLRMNGLMMNSI